MAHEGTGTTVDGTPDPAEDFYAVLGVRDDASTSEVKSAFRARARTWHPDAGGDATRFALLLEAYETLSDPHLRALYDGSGGHDDNSDDSAADGPDEGVTANEAPWPPGPMPPGRARARAFGEDPAFRPPRVRVDPESLTWWHAAGDDRRLRFGPTRAPGDAGPSALLAVAALATVVLATGPSQVVATACVGVAAVTIALAVALWRRQGRELHAARAEVRDIVFGQPGSDEDQIAERRTADLLDRYVTQLPGARIFHGVAWPGSVFADIDHAVLCGHRLLLIESKRWLPGHYSIEPDADGEPVLHRNRRRFGGGGSRLAEALDVFEDLLPGIEVRGALVLYPNRAGTITVDGGADTDVDTVHVLTPEGFLTEACAWLAEDPSTVDIRAFRAVLAQVVG